MKDILPVIFFISASTSTGGIMGDTIFCTIHAGNHYVVLLVDDLLLKV